MDLDLRETLSRSSDKGICWKSVLGAVTGGTWRGGEKAVMGDGAHRESGLMEWAVKVDMAGGGI